MLACASFFAGVGGIDFGFEQAGFDVVYANEFCEKASITFKQNHEVELDTRDIRDVPSTEIPDFDVMLAGFPCQAFSVAGYRQGFDDEKGRGNLYFELERIMKDKRPSIVFLENVKKLGGHDNGRTFRIIRSSMEGMGYKIHHKVMNACDYGDIPQNRERIYVVGFLDDGVSDCFSFPDEIPLETDIGDIFEFESRVDDKYYYGEDAYMYDELKRGMTSRETVYQWRRKYVRENKSRLCPTLTANMGTGGHNVPLIKTRHGFRKLTPKECFMIQGFDSSFVLPENVANSHLYKQAGNSVVVPVVKRIANSIISAIDLENSIQSDGIIVTQDLMAVNGGRWGI